MYNLLERLVLQVMYHPMRPHKEWLKLAAYENRLPDMVKTVKQLQKEIDALKAQLKES